MLKYIPRNHKPDWCNLQFDKAGQYLVEVEEPTMYIIEQ
jgi:hypothetical protein